MAKPWPPPPDLESLKELFATADVEGLIVEGSPLDEYDPEAKNFFEATVGWSSEQLTVDHTLPLLERMWVAQFGLDPNAGGAQRSKLADLAAQVERFFGPQAKPMVRGGLEG